MIRGRVIVLYKSGNRMTFPASRFKATRGADGTLHEVEWADNYGVDPLYFGVNNVEAVYWRQPWYVLAYVKFIGLFIWRTPK